MGDAYAKNWAKALLVFIINFPRSQGRGYEKDNL